MLAKTFNTYLKLRVINLLMKRKLSSHRQLLWSNKVEYMVLTYVYFYTNAELIASISWAVIMCHLLDRGYLWAHEPTQQPWRTGGSVPFYKRVNWGSERVGGLPQVHSGFTRSHSEKLRSLHLPAGLHWRPVSRLMPALGFDPLY